MKMKMICDRKEYPKERKKRNQKCARTMHFMRDVLNEVLYDWLFAENEMQKWTILKFFP